MAIFGAGSNWDGNEMKSNFFRDENYVIGWNYASAKDLYIAIAALKVGDIIYLKANAPGSRNVRIKGIGIVTKNFMSSLIDQEIALTDFISWQSLAIKVKWVVINEFIITIPTVDGKLTNIRAATFYEETLPCVQNQVLEHFLAKLV